MPYISTEAVKEKRKAIRAALPEYKVSVRRRDGSSVDVVIVEGPVDAPDGKTYTQVNRHYIDRHYADHPEWLRVLKTVKTIASSGMSGGFEDSDYGYVPGHYVNINIGEWDRPYEVVRKAA